MGHYALDLRFQPGGYEPTLETDAFSASLTRVFAAGWALTASGGGVLSGTMGGDAADSRQYDVRPGFVGALRVTRPLRQENGSLPFITTDVTVSYTRFTTELVTTDPGLATSGRFSAWDFMLGVTMGYTVGGFWQPYIAPRFFGGPIHWDDGAEDRTGSDRHHYQLGLGSAFILPGGTTLFVDGSPVGARGITAGLVYAFD